MRIRFGLGISEAHGLRRLCLVLTRLAAVVSSRSMTSTLMDGFETKNFGPSGISSFQSFCIEKSEPLFPWIPSPSEIAARKSSASLLQKAIWWLEGDGGAAYGFSALNLTTNHHWDRGDDDDDDDDDEQEHSYKKKPVAVPQAAVPDGGATVVMLGAALFAMAMRRKTLRFRSAKRNAHSVTNSV